MKATNLPRILGIKTCPQSACPLNDKPVWGIGPEPCDVFICGEAPGAQEAASGDPFVGQAGRLLRQKLREAGLQPEHLYLTNTVKCRPPDNRNPKASEIKLCVEKHLALELEIVKPKLVVAAGAIALKALTGKFGITRLNGKVLVTEDGLTVMPLIHPAAILRNQRLIGVFNTGISNIQKILEGQLVETGDAGVYTLPKTIEEVRAVFDEIDTSIRRTPVVALDVETDSLSFADPTSKVRSIGIAWQAKAAAAISLELNWTKNERDEICGLITGLLSDRRIEKVMHNAKFDINFLRKLGVQVRPPLFDTKIAQFLVNELVSTGLKDLAWTYTKMGGYEGMSKPQDMSGDKLLIYNCKDADITLRIRNILKQELPKHNVQRVFEDLLMPVSFALADMESRGIRIDLKLLNLLEGKVNDVNDRISRKMAQHTAVRKWVGQYPALEFNPSSTTHLRQVVFDIMQKKPYKLTPTQQPSVDRESMDFLSGDMLIDLIIDYKEVQKYKSTYIESIKTQRINDRIHTQYLLWIARSGRTSSKNPNLQNLPHVKSGSVAERYGINIRDLFIADPGCTFDEVDYNQHELRIMAIASQDPVMMYIFNQGLDIHEETAKSIFNTAAPTEEQRRKSKTVNFGIMYGMGVLHLSKTLNCTQTEARTYISGFYRKFRGVQRWKTAMELFVKTHGYIKTLTGRRRHFPTIDGDLTDQDLREAVNTPIQGTASDLLLYSIIGIDKMLKYHELKSSLCLQVHDSILINVYDGERKKVRSICKQVMLNPPIDFKLHVPLAIDYKRGQSWGSLVKG